MKPAGVTQASDWESGGASAQVGDFPPTSRAQHLRGLTPAIHFDPLRRAASASLKVDIKALAAWLAQQEFALGLRKRARAEASQRGFRLAVEAIVCNLLALRLMRCQRPLAVPRGATAMWSTRSGSQIYGQHFLDALDIMGHAEIGLIVLVAKGYRFVGGVSQRSTIKAGPAFNVRFPSADIDWTSLTRDELGEVLILHGKKDEHGDAPPIDYRATRRTNMMARQVRRINAWLNNAPLFVLDDNEMHDGRELLDSTDRNLRRIFNNGSWYNGGRLFGGFWQTMPRANRFRYLRIGTKAHPEGEEIANVDFSHLFPRLAYHDANLLPPRQDLYDVLGDSTYRSGFKKLINAMLSADRRFTRYPEGVAKELPPDLPVAKAIELVERKHAPITDRFFIGIGLKFMFKESEMLIDALETLWKHQSIVALPLHDSVLVGQGDAEAAKTALETAFSFLHEGARGHVSIDIGQ